MQQHVPAWKRIGLKLKYAKDSSPRHHKLTEDKITAASNEDHKATETTNGNEIRPSKKRKLSPASKVQIHHQSVKPPDEGHSKLTEASESTSSDSSSDEEEQINQTTRDDSEQKQESSVGKPASQARRKSVTFTPETKTEDGFSASTIFKQSSQIQGSTGAELDSVKSSEASNQPAKQDKDIKSKKREKKSKARHKPYETPSYLSYLQQFANDRASWKFNKRQQSDLFKNLFDTKLIPPEHNPSLLQYISGLQGEAAKKRLVEEATSILRAVAERQGETDLDNMESEEARREAYAAALKKNIQRYERLNVKTSEYDEQQLADIKDELDKTERAQAVLGELGELLLKELHPETARTSVPTSNGNGVHTKFTTNETNDRESSISTNSTRTSAPSRKKRKIRTAAADSDSSSSSSNSDSETESSEGPATLQEALAPSSDPIIRQRSEKSSTPSTTSSGQNKRIVFSDDLLDKAFPKKKKYHEVAPKRKRGKRSKARGWEYTHGTKDDESGSESE